MSIKIKFCGAAGTVTGSCYWVQTAKSQFLVDCGLFQGTKTVKELNYSGFPFDPKQIDFVVLTHAHTDHSAMIPKLIKDGFGGPIYCTEASRALLRYMLPDSGYIQEMEVMRLNRRNQQRGKPAVKPIYTRRDAEATITQIHGLDYEDWIAPGADVRARFWNAGHILGSASVEIEIVDGGNKRRLLFSGDIGPEHKLFHAGPDAPGYFDYVICEATYGGRERPRFPSPNGGKSWQRKSTMPWKPAVRWLFRLLPSNEPRNSCLILPGSFSRKKFQAHLFFLIRPLPSRSHRSLPNMPRRSKISAIALCPSPIAVFISPKRWKKANPSPALTAASLFWRQAGCAMLDASVTI